MRDVDARFSSQLRTSGWKVHQGGFLRCGRIESWGKSPDWPDPWTLPVLVFAWSVVFPIRKGPVTDKVELTRGIFRTDASPLEWGTALGPGQLSWSEV